MLHKDTCAFVADAYVVLVRRGPGQLSVPRIQRHHGMGPGGNLPGLGCPRSAIRGHEDLADPPAADCGQTHA